MWKVLIVLQLNNVRRNMKEYPIDEYEIEELEYLDIDRSCLFNPLKGNPVHHNKI